MNSELWSTALEFLEPRGSRAAVQIWNEFPILDYGKKWDVGFRAFRVQASAWVFPGRRPTWRFNSQHL